MTEAQVQDLCGHVLSAGSALAGLVLVFLGNAVSGFDSHPLQYRTPKLISRYRERGERAIVAFFLAILAAACGVGGTLMGGAGWAYGGLVSLSISAAILVAMAMQMVLNIE